MADTGIDTAALTKLLEALVPEAGGKITDIKGNEYPLPMALSARRQIRVLRAAEKMRAAAVTDEEAAALAVAFSAGGAGGGAVGALAGIVLALASNDAFLIALGEAFDAALPDVASAGCSAAGTKDALEAFALEEIAAALLPFFGQILRRAGSLLTTLTVAAPAPAPAPEA